jgi:HK97 family phage major capsid protein
MSEKTPTLVEVMEAVNELRSDVDKKGTVDPEKLEKINVTLDTQEKDNQKLLTEIKAAEAREKELKERLDVLESEVARESKEHPNDYKDRNSYKALRAFVTKGRDDSEYIEHKATLRTDIDTQGGYLVEPEIDTMILKKVTEISALRQISRVRTIGKKSLVLPKRNGLLVATFEGETKPASESTSTYANETITAHRQTVVVPITHDQLMDSSFNMEVEIFGDASESFAQNEGNLFILGNGVKQPEGILVNADLLANAYTSTTTSGVITADDMILLTGQLKAGYNPVYTFNRLLLASLRTQKSTDGVFLWQPGMNGPVANTINGFPYALSIDMPNVAANSYSVAFGDFQRGYVIVDRTGVSIIRDDLTAADSAIVKFTIHRWLTGQVVQEEAIKLMKTKA